MGALLKLLIIRRVRMRRRNHMIATRRYLRDSQNPFDVSEQKFIELYRFPKELFNTFLEELLPRFYVTSRITAIPPFMRLLCALRFFASGGYQRNVGYDFLSSLSQASVSRSVQQVVDILNDIFNQHVSLPKEEVEEKRIKEDFHQIASFPEVVGIIAGIRIRIITPRNDIEKIYVCPLGGHSINMIVICDSNHIIQYMNADNPGSSLDANIWLSSTTIRDNFQKKYEEGSRDFWLLGDSKFPLEPWLMTPIDAASNGAEERYNSAHKKTRSIIGKCFKIFTTRFPCLSEDTTLCYDPAKAALIVKACAVLHNVLIRAKIPLPEVNADSDETNERAADPHHENVHTQGMCGMCIRQKIVNDCFTI